MRLYYIVFCVLSAVPYYAYLNSVYGALRLDPATGVLSAVSDYNQMTLFVESVCSALSFPSFNSTPNCVSLAASGVSGSLVTTGLTSIRSLPSDTSDRYKVDTSFVEIPNALNSGYFSFQPSAAYGTTFYLSVNTASSNRLLTLVPNVLNQNAASFYKTTVLVSSK
jgi:hypothetical protein